jgi:medium-chain acyl-[acyl-carrier-protein] hydrolase
MTENGRGWLTRWSTGGDVRHRLLCFPYAGASGVVFRTWASALPAGLEVCAVELPGRWYRRDEPPIPDVRMIVERLAEAVAPFTDLPFSIYGHSFGALLGFEFAREMRRRGGTSPRTFFAAAHKAPDLPAALPLLHVLPDQEFLLGCARRYGALDERLVADAEVRDIIIGPMRGDITALESYDHTEEPPLDCELLVLGGRLDRSVRDADLHAWGRHGRGGAMLAYLPGGHLFIKDDAPTLLEQIRSTLGRYLIW